MRIPRTTRNIERLQTPCANCRHPEWDHYMHSIGSDSACDSGGCRCGLFEQPEEKPVTDPVFPSPADRLNFAAAAAGNRAVMENKDPQLNIVNSTTHQHNEKAEQ